MQKLEYAGYGKDGLAIRTIWTKQGQLHREDGPAVEDSDGSYKAWYVNGQLHREDGPAQIYNDANGEKCWWWLNHKIIDCSTQEEFEQLIKLRLFW